MAMWTRIGLAGLAGYVTGSFLPAYFLGRLIAGIDIRTVHYRNAGTRNVKKALGLWPAVVTAICDTGKGVGALFLARAAFSISGYALLAPAVSAVVGHIFPFYLRFRGGRGTATAIGVFLYVAALAIVDGALPLPVFVGLLVSAGLIYGVTRSGDATALFVFLGMAVISVGELGFSPDGTLALVMSGYVFLHAVFRGRDLGLYHLPDREDFIGWRVVARPLALLFIPLHRVMPHWWFLGLLSVLAAAALIVDVYRVVSRRAMSGFYRSSEGRKLSSITLFLVSVLLLFVLFHAVTAYIALSFLAIGDLAGKLLGMRFGRREILAGRTLEGSVGFLVGALLAGYGLARVFGEPSLPVVLAGAAGAAVIELLTIGLDDNLTVGLGSAGLLALLGTL